MLRTMVVAALLLAGCSGGGGTAGGTPTPTAAAATGLTKGSGTIVAGQSLDNVKLGEAKAQVEKDLGEPTERDTGFSKSQTYSLYKDKGLELVYDDDKVAMIVAHAEEGWTPYTGATADGLWVGSTKEEIIKTLGPPKEDPGKALDYTAKGIWFTFQDNGRVETIRIIPPR